MKCYGDLEKWCFRLRVGGREGSKKKGRREGNDPDCNLDAFRPEVEFLGNERKVVNYGQDFFKRFRKGTLLNILYSLGEDEGRVADNLFGPKESQSRSL